MKVEPRRNSAAYLRRWIGALLFLSIFFLPLHIHIATAAGGQLSKECSCVQGTRTQLAPSASLSAGVAHFASTYLVVSYPSVWLCVHSSSQDVRAPPLASL
jgi:hypothetical protein